MWKLRDYSSLIEYKYYNTIIERGKLFGNQTKYPSKYLPKPLNSATQAFTPRRSSKLLNVELARTTTPAEAYFSVSPYKAVVKLYWL